MNCDFLVPQRIVPFLREATAKFFNSSIEEVLVYEDFKTNYDMQFVNIVGGSMGEEFEQGAYLADELSKVFQCAICIIGNTWNVMESYKGKYIKELEMYDYEDEEYGIIPRFRDPPEGMTEP